MSIISKKRNAYAGTSRGRINPFIAAPLLFIALFTLLAVIGAYSQRAGMNEADNLVIGLKNEPRFLNPILASDSKSMEVNSYIFNTLIRYGDDMEFEPELARSWEILDGGARVIFHLRDDVKWHDGERLTARDCVFTFEKVLDPRTNTFNAVKWGQRPIFSGSNSLAVCYLSGIFVSFT
ncbi:MAG: hypothetical protein K8T10_03455 [Candidatus Eremiobacteraeota bacterium]|nr:hypothetical protein [Candidatus Eremiobacteraeota bacterium]